MDDTGGGGRGLTVVYTWAITSWRTSFSRAAAQAKSMSVMWASSSSICFSVIGSPRECSALAREIQSFRQVSIRFCWENRCSI